MKKVLSILLALLMALSLTACIRLKTPEVAQPQPETKSATKAAAPAATKGDAAAPVATEEPAPTEVPAPTEAPVPTEEPAPAEVPGDEAIAAAHGKLADVKSLHTDMKMNMDMEVTVSIAGWAQTIPMDINISLGMDAIREPQTVRMELSLTAPGEEENILAYAVRDGEDTVVYASDDGGLTWQKQTNPEDGQMIQSPEGSMELLSGAMADIRLVGTTEVNGASVAVYSGKVPGKFLGEILSSTGAGEEMAGSLGDGISAEDLEKLSDMDVTVMIDEESGLPVRYSIDMTAAMRDLMEAMLLKNMEASSLEEAGVALDVSAVTMDLSLSQFDSIDSIEIPEAALNAPEM